MRVIGYARLSRAVDESTSIARQRQIIQKAADARGFELVDTVEDNDVSATRTRLDRPGLNEVRRRIAAGEAEAVVVWRLDRLVRSVVDVGILLDEGLQIVSATENLDTTTPMGRAMVEILQVFAAMEAKTIGLRVSSSRQYLPTVGRFPGGNVPYGYRPCPHPGGVGRALEPHPDEAPVVRRIVDALLAGEPSAAVARALNADGVPTRSARTGKNPESRWHPSTIRLIVTGDAILGRVVSKGRLVRDDLGLPVVAWPPLISLDESARLRARFEDDPARGEKIAAGRGRKASRLLSGLILCSSCGRPLVARNDTRRSSVYSCVSRSRGVPCERPVSISADAVEAEVTRRFLSLFGRWDVVEEQRVAVEDARLSEVEAAIRDTTDELRAPDADVLALVDRLNGLREERERLATLRPKVETVRVPTGETFVQAWESAADYRGQREILLSAGVEVVVDPPTKHPGRRADLSRVRLLIAGEERPIAA
ncbi:recombinase family protein [Agromyces indicus]|uniref:Recombinase family protein n=1 Tax=Agromyces indicus TaxID=758919 RepID=A0ABU1FJD5_9MICO|nr:recombinase family protein [Agromyces indicus]MDR5691873.1 recombinase family protein [Agromyces indicus]